VVALLPIEQLQELLLRGDVHSSDVNFLTVAIILLRSCAFLRVRM
jgi:hypothetical protein